MRRDIAERARRLKPGVTVVLTGAYHIRTAHERAFSELIQRLQSSIAGDPGLLHFEHHTPVNSSGRPWGRHDTYEKWDSPESFLSYWNSEPVERFHQAVEPLQQPDPPSRMLLSMGQATPVPGPTPGVHEVQPFATGQTESWDSDGQPRGKGAGDDGDWEAGYSSSEERRFRDNGDGTVTDTLTDLIWLKNANLFGEVSWPEALYNAGQLGAGAAGLTDKSRPGDWRLPNVNEMQSLLDSSKTFGPSLPSDSPFSNLEATNYWTSSSVAMDQPTPLGWFVALAVGPPVFDLKFNRMRMWPVRGRSTHVIQTGQRHCYDVMGQIVDCSAGRGQDAALKSGVPWPAKRFTDNDDGTITDTLTGLVWLQNADAFGRLSWQDALDACNGLEDGKYGLEDDSKREDWRLPNVNELRSLIDYSEFAPSLPKTHPFTHVRSSLYWSSTTVASAPRFARFVFIGVGPSVWDHKGVLMNVWPVRDQI
jgi:quinol monooxygenase YgiN